MRILITGSKGQLGLETAGQLQRQNDIELLLTDVENLDITDINSVSSFVSDNKPDAIINCAAYTAVDACETNDDTAYKINAIGPRNLAIASMQAGIKLIHISTDYVFDGNGIRSSEGQIRPYNEFDAPCPQTVYGKTKYEGELFVRSINPRHFIIRTAWLYGNGNNFVRTMLKLAQEKDSVKVVNDQRGTPTSTVELARMINFLLGTDNYGLFHGTCEGECTWYDFTKEIYHIMGIKTEVVPVTSEEYPRPAKRPKYSVLDNYMLRLSSDFSFLHWQEEIDNYLRKCGGGNK